MTIVWILLFSFILFFIICIFAAVERDHEIKAGQEKPADEMPRVGISKEVPSVYDIFKNDKKHGGR